LNPYSWTKKSCEDIIKVHNPAHTILRIFTTYGNAGPLVLDKWVDQHKRGELITLRGDGTQQRDFIHVEDVANAIFKVSQVKPNGLTLDVGTGITVSLKLLASMFGSEVYQEPELRGYAYSTRANSSQTKKLLDWNPAYSVENWILTNLGS
jgi:UDP-glucose 4-epimerase